MSGLQSQFLGLMECLADTDDVLECELGLGTRHLVDDFSNPVDLVKNDDKAADLSQWSKDGFENGEGLDQSPLGIAEKAFLIKVASSAVSRSRRSRISRSTGQPTGSSWSLSICLPWALI